MIGYSYGGKLLPILAYLLERSGKKVSKIIVLDTIINLADESSLISETKISLELAKIYLQRHVARKYTVEEFGITSAEILKKVARIISGSTEESMERTYQELRLAHEVYLTNAKHSVKFRSKIAADIVGIFTSRLMDEFPEKVLEWGSYTNGNFAYEIVDCEHTEMLTHDPNKTASLLMSLIKEASPAID